MLLKQHIVPYFRRAVALKSPEVETDVAYIFTDDELWDMITMSIWEHNPSYNVNNFPKNELPFLMLVARKELYFRLATASAPFYPLSAEGAELRKDYRFEHYMSLIRFVTTEYDNLLNRFNSTRGVEHGVLLKNKQHLRHLQYNDLELPSFNLDYEVDEDVVILRWSKFKSVGDKFKMYKVYISETKIDEFTNLDTLEPVYTQSNIHVTSCKLAGLKRGILYYIAVVHQSINDLQALESVEIMRGELIEPIRN